MKRSDFLWWGIGILFIYLGISGSFNPTLTHGIYIAYPWQVTAGLLFLAMTGAGMLWVPAHIDLLQKENEDTKPIRGTRRESSGKDDL